mgnify:CR=1 FL=1
MGWGKAVSACRAIACSACKHSSLCVYTLALCDKAQKFPQKFGIQDPHGHAGRAGTGLIARLIAPEQRKLSASVVAQRNARVFMG